MQIIIAAKKEGVTSGVKEIFQGFQPKQFFTVLGMLILAPIEEKGLRRSLLPAEI